MRYDVSHSYFFSVTLPWIYEELLKRESWLYVKKDWMGRQESFRVAVFRTAE